MRSPRRISEILLYAASPLSILVTAPILARGLGPEARGEFGILQAVASFGLSIGALGQAEVLLAERKTPRAFSSATVISLGGGVIATIGATLVLLVMDFSYVVVGAAVVLLPLMVQAQIWRALAVADHRLALPALQNGLGAIGRVLGLALLFSLGVLGTSSGILTIQLAVVLSSIICFAPLIGREAANVGAALNGVELSVSLRAGLPLIVFTLLTSVTLRADLFVLQSSVPAAQLGTYAAVSSLTMAVLSISPAFKVRVQSAALGVDPLRSVRKEAFIALGFSLLGITALILLAPWIVAILLGPDYGSAETPLRFLAFSCGALLMLDVVQGLLAAIGGRKQLVQVSLLGACATLASLLILVPNHGLEGAAIAISVGYSVIAIVGWFLAVKLIDDANGAKTAN